MTNHPNRGPKGPSSNPTPTEIRAAREEAGLTQSQAAALVHSSSRNWQQWEDQTGGQNARRMHPGLWELFRLKAKGTFPAEGEGNFTDPPDPRRSRS